MPLDAELGKTMLQLITSRYDDRHWRKKIEKTLGLPQSGVGDPAQQQIMRYRPLMMMVFLYNFQAGLTLYWTVQNLLSIAQMKITRSAPEQPQAGVQGKPGRPIKPLAPPPKKK